MLEPKIRETTLYPDMKLYVQQIPGVSAVSSVSLNGESDLLIDLNDTRIVLEAKITNSFVKILDTLWDQVPKYLEKLGTNYFVIIAYPENIRQITADPEESKKSLEMAINAWKTRNELSPKIGKGKYVLAEYEKIKRITLPLGGDHMLYITTEPQADHVKILDGISKLSLD